MKKIMAMGLSVLLTAGLCAPSFAAKPGKKAEKKFERIVAQVVSVDAAARTMVVTREENGEQRIVTISEKAAAKVNAGDRVRIKLKAGTNESAGVRVLGAKPAADDAAAEPESNGGSTAESKTEVK